MTTELLEERSVIFDFELPMTRLIEHAAIIGNGAHARRWLGRRLVRNPTRS
jgi:hypothetical protein